MKESHILKECLLAMSKEFHPGIFYRQNAGKVQTATGYWIELGPDGIGDIVGFIPSASGAVFFCGETKTRRGQQRESQKRFQAAVEKAGGVYVLGRSGEEMVKKTHEALKSLPGSPRPQAMQRSLAKRPAA
ncbi:MAG: hypothetical protein ACXIUV_07060 [Alkalilacustris sp.]